MHSPESPRAPDTRLNRLVGARTYEMTALATPGLDPGGGQDGIRWTDMFYPGRAIKVTAIKSAHDFDRRNRDREPL
jgi:hypothetical protein